MKTVVADKTPPMSWTTLFMWSSLWTGLLIVVTFGLLVANGVAEKNGVHVWYPTVFYWSTAFVEGGFFLASLLGLFVASENKL